MGSVAEERLSRSLRAIVTDLPDGATIPDSDEFRHALVSLQYFIPIVLAEIYREWRFEGLDDVLPSLARNTGNLEIEIFGLCCLVADQSFAPLHLRLQLAVKGDEVSWLECRLGERGPHGMIRIPSNWSNTTRARPYPVFEEAHLFQRKLICSNGCIRSLSAIVETDGHSKPSSRQPGVIHGDLRSRRRPGQETRAEQSGAHDRAHRERSVNDDIPTRRNYHESCKFLQEQGYFEDGSIPPLPDHQPQYDDEEPLGVSFFRTFVGEGDFENLTLPRTYIARSEVGPISFKNTDFSESTFCWNDFTEVNFTDAELSQSDLRSSYFVRAVFLRTKLCAADLRHSLFEACDFTDADMRGAKLTHEQGDQLKLSEQQKKEIDWQESEGEEPPGG